MKLWLTGGFVRDHLLGCVGKHDVDFSVEAASYEAMRDTLVNAYGVHVWQERPEYVTLRGRVSLDRLGSFGDLLHPSMGHSRDNSVDVDFTLCRKEAMYSDGRHPDNVTPATVHVDLARRDFSVNAVAVSETGEWLDPHGGRVDCERRVLDTVGAPEDRFGEDALRMLRAFRFTVTKDLRPSARVMRALDNNPLLMSLTKLPTERVLNEMHKAFAHNWLYSMQLLTCEMSGLGSVVYEYFPKLWLKATTEAR